jgi:DNA-binding SARP family transcriptional activator
MALTIRLLGPFQLAPLSEKCSRKGQWAIALLTLRHGREVERAWLAGTLWPDADEEQALYNLRRELTRLRRALGAEAHRIVTPTPRTIRLELDGAEVDLLAFEAGGGGDDAALARAVELYRGPLLEGCAEEWVVEEREARRQAYLKMLAELAARAQAHADTPTATRALRLQTAADPLDENAHRGLMQALAQGGAPGAAVEAYRELRLRLATELATEPAPETRALYHRIRSETRSGGAPSSPPRDERGRIPRPLTPLVGRADEVGTIEARLAASRLVTLTGSGGVGKTRLAMKVANDVASGFADGAWFVELAPVAQAELVARTVASALDVKEASDRALAATLADFLRPRQALLVLDNCEHLVGACAELAAFLLHECAHLRVLATSRQSLGLSGEVVWRVPSLAAGDAVELFRERSGIERALVAGRARGRGADLPPPRRAAPGDRARGRAHQGPLRGTDRRAPGRSISPAHRRRSQRAVAAAHAQGDRRVELSTADAVGAGAFAPSGGVPGGLVARGSRGDIGRRCPRSPRSARRQVAGGVLRPLPSARDGARICPRAAGGAR